MEYSHSLAAQSDDNKNSPNCEIAFFCRGDYQKKEIPKKRESKIKENSKRETHQKAHFSAEFFFRSPLGHGQNQVRNRNVGHAIYVDFWPMPS